MGLYIYRITKHVVEVILPSGERAKANVAAFSYKPTWSDESLNTRWGREAARRIPAGKPCKYFVCGEEDGTVAPGATVYENPRRNVNLPDDLFGSYYLRAAARVAPRPTT
jgi:hypothetical protein